jgi:2-pyrone-4,6-dicarboxylate lactonase
LASEYTLSADKLKPLLTYKLQPSTTVLKLPPMACDSHVHIFGPAERFAYAPTRSFTPVDAPKETLFALHHPQGIERCVIVQSLVHGMDNSVVEDAIAAGGGRYLGVSLVPVDVPDAELERLAMAGIRGVRFHFMPSLTSDTSINAIVALTQRLKPLNMHLQVHFDGALIHQLVEPLSRSAVPVVIDHMGRVDATRGAEHADFAALLTLLKNPKFHVKVSGIDRIDSFGSQKQPPYAQGVVLARLLVERFPEQCVWGTDWPHPNHTHVPDDGVLVDALSRIAPTQALLDQVLVHNPQRLYRFIA